MASTKESNTSKTAHVMNLLSRTRGAAEPAPDAPSAQPPAEPKTTAAPAPQIPPILTSMEADAAVSTQIKDALEDALASSLEAEPVVITPPPAQHPAASPAEPEPGMPNRQPSQPQSPAAGSPAPEEAPPAAKISTSDAPPPAMQWPDWGEDGTPDPEPTPAPTEAVQSPAPPQEQAPSAPAAPPEDARQPLPSTQNETPPSNPQEEDAHHEITYVNVMEVLVEERAGKYMEMFGMCQCERCKIDVKALALNNLPSKYVVMAKGEFVPRITVYEGRFSAAIIAQLLRACKIVADSPRHKPLP